MFHEVLAVCSYVRVIDNTLRVLLMFWSGLQYTIDLSILTTLHTTKGCLFLVLKTCSNPISSVALVFCVTYRFFRFFSGVCHIYSAKI